MIDIKGNLKSGTKNLILGALTVGTLLFNVACSTSSSSAISSVVTNVTLDTTTQSGDQWIKVVASLATGGFELAGINVPVINPQDPSVEYGQLTLVPSLNSSGAGFSGGELTISLNLTAVSGIQGLGATLPNGTAIPVGGLENANVIDLPLNGTGARLYFAFGPGIAMLGTTVAFAALDPLGQYVPGIDVFVPLNFGPVSLTAGIFAGSATDTTGIGLFIDLANVMNQAPASAPVASDMVGRFMHSGRMNTGSSAPVNNLVLKTVEPSDSDRIKLFTKMYDMSNQRITLKAQ